MLPLGFFSVKPDGVVIQQLKLLPLFLLLPYSLYEKPSLSNQPTAHTRFSPSDGTGIGLSPVAARKLEGVQRFDESHADTFDLARMSRCPAQQKMKHRHRPRRWARANFQ